MNRRPTDCRTSAAVAIVLATLTVALGGCSAPHWDNWKLANLFDLERGMPWDKEGPQHGIPVRMVDTWTDTVLHRAGQTPQRGFGGRLVFYGENSNEPILVDGQLVVYAFDESNREPTDNRPTRRFVFPADQMSPRMSESEIGPSYSFWLPWDEVGGPQTEVSLICRFEPKGGSLIVGEQTRHLLPGTLLAADGRSRLPANVPTRPNVAQTMYSAGSDGDRHALQGAEYYDQQADNAAGGAAQQPIRRMQTTSISLPASFSRGGIMTGVRAGTQWGGASASPPQAAPVQPTHAVRRVAAPPAAVQSASPASTVPAGVQTSPPVENGASTLVPGQMMPAQPTTAEPPAPRGWTTTVNYPSPEESARRRWGQWSFGSAPPSPPAPATRAFQ